MRTTLGECPRCRILAYAPTEGDRPCPECGRALTRALVHVGFADARRVYGEPGEPYVPPARPPSKERVFVLTCADGHTARSEDERRIDDWLHARGIRHEREPKLKGMRPGRGTGSPASEASRGGPREDGSTETARRPLKWIRPDWRVGDVYIEYWGLANQQGYEARREEKLALYRARGLKLIELFPEDVERLEEKLGPLVHVRAGLDGFGMEGSEQA